MRAEDLLEAVGAADEELLERSEQGIRRRRPVRGRKKHGAAGQYYELFKAAAACILILILGGVYLRYSLDTGGSSGSTAAGEGEQTAAIMEELLVTIREWRTDGFLGIIEEGEFAEGERRLVQGDEVLICIEENTEVVLQDGSILSGADLWETEQSFFVGDTVSVGVQSYEPESGKIYAYHIEPAPEP